MSHSPEQQVTLLAQSPQHADSVEPGAPARGASAIHERQRRASTPTISPLARPAPALGGEFHAKRAKGQRSKVSFNLSGSLCDPLLLCALCVKASDLTPSRKDRKEPEKVKT